MLQGPAEPVTAELSERLTEALGRPWVSAAPADRLAYARDLWPRGHLMAAAGDLAPHPPDIVCWPADAGQAAMALSIAADLGVPIVPYGAGSGVCGGTWATHGGLIVDCKRLRELAYDPDSGWVSAGAGWIGQHLEDALERRGRTLGHFPSSIHCSTLGGWVAARSAGQLSSRYGKIEDMVRSLRVALPDGTLQRLDRDEAQLIVGSEGTLAVVTDATLVTHPQPAARDLTGWRLPNVPTGVDAMRRLMQAGLRPSALRLYDEFDTVLALREHDEAGGEGGGSGGGAWKRRALRLALENSRLINRATALLPGGCLLITGYEGDADLVAAEAAEGEVILRSVGAEPLGPEPGLRWFARRHSVSYKQPPVFGAGAWVDTMEVATTWSAVPALYDAVRRAAGRHVFVMAHFSHAYPEGCSIYFSYAGGPVGTTPSSRAAAIERYDAAWADALKVVADHRATISHHHGVGMSKAHHMLDEQGAGGRRMFERAKAAYDPEGRMNPGKLWTDDPERDLPEPPPLRPEDLLLVCAPDERPADVERRARSRGATLGPLDPGLETIGAALRRPTPDSPRYGRPLDRVVAIEAHLPDGSVFQPTRAPRKAVGPDYVRWIMTTAAPVADVRSITVRLMPLPAAQAELAAPPEEIAAEALDIGIRPASTDRDRWRLEGPRRCVDAEIAWLEGRLAGLAPAPEDAADEGA